MWLNKLGSPGLLSRRQASLSSHQLSVLSVPVSACIPLAKTVTQTRRRGLRQLWARALTHPCPHWEHLSSYILGQCLLHPQLYRTTTCHHPTIM